MIQSIGNSSYLRKRQRGGIVGEDFQVKIAVMGILKLIVVELEACTGQTDGHTESNT